MFHIISNSSIGHLDPEEEQHVLNNNTEYIIVVGNLSLTNKRTMLYAETLATMYPTSLVIFNHGVLESYNGIYKKIEDGFDLHVNDFKKSPTNLYFPKGKCVGDYDFYCTIGWPTLIEERNFQESYFIKSLQKGMDQEIYIDDVLMSTYYTRYFTLENVIEECNKEKIKVAEWLANDQGKPKILISALGDQCPSYVGESSYRTFDGLNLSGITWICGSDHDFIGPYRGANVISLPGRDRTRYVSQETMNLVD